MTNTITWQRYDGTEETLPEGLPNVLVLRVDDKIIRFGRSRRDSHGKVYFWEAAPAGYYSASPGDLWAYLPNIEEVKVALDKHTYCGNP